MCDNVSKIEEIIQKLVKHLMNNYQKHVSERLGMDDSMKNILLRITLCSLEYQISSEEANEIYNKIYSNIHRGSIGGIFNLRDIATHLDLPKLKPVSLQSECPIYIHPYLHRYICETRLLYLYIP